MFASTIKGEPLNRVKLIEDDAQDCIEASLNLTRNEASILLEARSPPEEGFEVIDR